MSKKTGKQMSNLPKAYITAMDLLQQDNNQLREEIINLNKIIKSKNIDNSHCPLCGEETLFTDPKHCTTIDCPNCIF